MEKRKQRGKQKSHQARDDAKEANEDIVKERTEQITDETLPEFLRGTLSRDDSIRETSERGLRRFQNNPRSMVIFARVLASYDGGDRESDLVGVKMAAGVILKRKISLMWVKIEQREREEVKRLLLFGLGNERERAVRDQMSECVGRIGQLCIPSESWPELLESLSVMQRAERVEEREAAVGCFAKLAELVVRVAPKHFEALAEIFIQSLGDRDKYVRKRGIEGCKALVGEAPFIGEVVVVEKKKKGANETRDGKTSKTEIEQQKRVVRDTVLRLVEASARFCVQAASSAESTDLALLAFDVFDELFSVGESQTVKTVAADIVSVCCECAKAQTVDNVVKLRALDILAVVSERRSKSLRKANLVEPMLRAILPLLGEPDEDEDDEDKDHDKSDSDDDDEEENQSCRLAAARVIDTLALALPAKFVLHVVLEFASNNIKSEDERLRRASIGAVGVICEGCAEALSNDPVNCENILEQLSISLEDKSFGVRRAAAFALGQFAEYCRSSVPKMHSICLPRLFQAVKRKIGAKEDAIARQNAFFAVEAWTSELESGEIASYVPMVLDVLFEALDDGERQEFSWSVFRRKESALAIATSAATDASDTFSPFLAELLPRLERVVSAHIVDENDANDQKKLRLRACAIRLLGAIVEGKSCRAVLGDHAIEALVQNVASGFALTSCDAREAAHDFFASFAQGCKSADEKGGVESFSQFLNPLVEKALESITLDDGIMFGEDLEDFYADNPDDDDEADEDYEDEFDEDDEDGNNAKGYDDVRSGLVEEKIAAIRAIKAYADAAPSTYVQSAAAYEKSMEVLFKTVDYLDDEVRSFTYESIGSLAGGECLIFLSLHNAAAAKTVAEKALESCLDASFHDFDKNVVASSLCCAAEILKSVKKINERFLFAVSETHLGRLNDISLSLLRGDAMCQQSFDSDDEDEDDDLFDDEDEDRFQRPSQSIQNVNKEENEDDEEAESSLVLLEAVAEVLPALASVVGAQQFASTFEPHFEAILKRLHPSRSGAERCATYGLLTDIVESVDAYAAPCSPALFPILLDEMRKLNTPEATRNASYLAGLLVEISRQKDKSNANPYCNDDMVKAIAEAAVVGSQSDAFIITSNHVGRWAKLLATKDNLAGCAARCAKSLANASESIEIAKAIVHALPMGEDMDESEIVAEVLKTYIVNEMSVDAGIRADAAQRIELAATASANI
jgi:importin-4